MMRFAPAAWFANQRLRTKLVLFALALVVCVSVFFYVYIPARISESASEALKAKGMVVAAMTAANVSPAMVFDDTLQIRSDLLNGGLSGDLVYAVVSDTSGRIYVAWGLDQAEQAKFQQTPVAGDMFEDSVLRLRSPLKHLDQQIGTLYLGFSNASVIDRVRQARIRTFLVTLLVLISSMAVVVGVTTALTHNLQRVVITAQKVAQGDLDQRVHVTTRDDAGELGDAFNLMLDRLGEYRNELADANRDLEVRVARRTKDLAEEVEEHRKTEESLRLSENRTRQVIDLVPHFIFAKDISGRFILANAAIAEAHGLTVEAMLGKRETDFSAPDEVERFERDDSEVINSGKRKIIHEETFTRADGKRRTLQTVKIPFPFSEANIPAVLGVSIDITDLKEYQEMLQSSLREKEVMLKEIHHRVKNNLQVISSLLSLQSVSLTDPDFKEMMLESQNRIRSMALVHERLYRSGTLASIDFSDYLSYVTTQLMRTYYPIGVECIVNAEPETLTVDDAVPCGLIVNELVSNSLKHAFRGRESGVLEVRFSVIDKDTFELVVKDDGVGFPEGINFSSLPSMGMTLVTNLTEQLQGKMELERGSGTLFRLRFPRRA
jgi:PAS domain S-box-containing protein